MAPDSQLKKFRIKPGDRILTLHAPENFSETLGSLPGNVRISSMSANPQQVHWFVKTRKEVEQQAKKVADLIKDEVLLWVYFPKASSKLQSDLTRDKGWEELQKHDLRMITLVSFDATWSAFAMKKGKTAKKITSPDPAIKEYIDTQKRIVKIPADLAEALNKHVNLKEKFEKLPFTHKKEYVVWIVSAKKEETRLARIKGTIDKLQQ